MAESTLLIVLVGLATLGAVYFLLAWFYELRRLRKMTYIEVRNAQIEEELQRERRLTTKERIRAKLTSLGLGGDPAPLAMGVAFAYLLVASVLSFLGLPSVAAAAIAAPTAIAAVVAFAARRRAKMAAEVPNQTLQLLRNVVTYLESGSTPQQAFNQAALSLANPMRDDVLAALASRVGSEPLAKSLEPVALRYPSQAMTLLQAALEINDRVGAKLAPTLRQAAAVVESQLELAAEATAEVSQAKGEFIGVTVIIGFIGVMMMLTTGESARAAYLSPLGLVVLGLGIANFVFGVWRTMRTLRLAGSGQL